MTSPNGPGEFPDLADFMPTHVVPQDGLPAWEAPDVTRPTAALDAFLPVRLLSRRGEWAEILCANGWSAWVDGRLLVAVPQPPPTGGRPLSRAEDPQPLLARTSGTLERYRRAAGELGSGRMDAEAFRRGTRGLRAGVVIDGESIWLYDEPTGRWLFGDGVRLSTYAVVTGPGAPAAPEPPAAEPDSAAPPAVEDTPSAPPGPGHTAGYEPTRITDTPEGGGR